MSIKKLFGASDNEKNYLSNINEKDAFNEDIESAKNLREIKEKQDHNIPQINYADPVNFARYGSAYLYYKSAIERIVDYYPYDGSDAEINSFYNKSLDIEKYILDNLYPRTNGYINISVGSGEAWGTPTHYKEYGLPSKLEYITFYGGPNTGSGGTTLEQLAPNPYNDQFQNSNIYDTDIYQTEGLPSDYGKGTRTSNLRSNFDDGVTVEFWLKTGSIGTDFAEGIPTDRQVVFDMWNTEDTSSVDYGRIMVELTSSQAADAAGTPFLITVLSGAAGSTTGIAATALGTGLDSGILSDWKHYAITLKNSGSNLISKLYINGGLNHELTSVGEAPEALKSKNMAGRIGALLTAPEGSSAPAGSGKLSGSLDEFRFWKVARNGQQIGRDWFTQIRGGVNTDIANTTLGLYYKFNEGITGDAAIDQIVLDYGGRVCNGGWTGYAASSRNVGSAILEASASTKEYRDPIIYAQHSAVSGLKSGLLASGSYHDTNNNAAFLNLVPGWVLDEQENEELSDLSNIAHIAGAYFDKLYLQISQLPRLRQLNYVSGAYKPFTFSEHLPQSLGLYTPNLFIDASVMEQFANRTDTEVFEGDLAEVKNLIYINLYNNLTNIFKSKGTEKAIKNVFRCFNIDDKLLRVSINSNNNEFILRNNLEQTLINKNCLNFNNESNVAAVVYQKQGADTTNTTGYIHSSSNASNFEDRAGFTIESNIIFPHYMVSQDKLQRDFNTVSLFGINMVDTGSADSQTGADTTTLAYDKANFQVMAVRDSQYSKNVYFKLTSSLSPGFGTELTSSIFLNVYNNELWNLSARLKPSKYPIAGFVSGATVATDTYDLIFRGINTVSTNIRESFTVTASLDSTTARNFLNAAKRVSTGARRTNLTGTLRDKSDALISSIKCWAQYIEDDDLLQHTLDPENTGISGSYQNLSPLQWYYTNNDIVNDNTLAMNWNFIDLTGSDSAGVFTTQDFSSGSATARATQGWVGEVAGYQHPGAGYGFAQSSQDIIDKKHHNSYRFINPEHAVSSDMVQLFSDNDELFPNLRREEIIPNYVYTIEKSLYNAISEEMLDFFAGVIDFNNIIGHPINRYRGRYKAMEKLREAFFRRVTSISTVEKYIKYYKWFDDTLTEIISQLVPASAEFVNDVLNVVESHVLERNKYRSKFPTLDFIIDDLDAYMIGIHEREYPWHPGSSDVPRSPRRTDEREYFWKRRAIRSSLEISASFPDGAAATEVNSQRDTFKEIIYAQPHGSSTLPLLSTVAGQRYEMPDLIRKRFTTPYSFKVSDIKEIREADLTLGTNYAPKKNIEFAPATFRGLGKVETSGGVYIPLNVLSAKAQDMVAVPEFIDVTQPKDYIKKQYRSFKVMYGPNFEDGLTYLNTDTHHAFPFNIVSSTVETGFNEEVIRGLTGGIEVTNRHAEGWGSVNNVGMQGPFPRHNVGGHQSRHVPLNKGTDDWMNRPERDKVLIGGLHGNAIGIVDPFYPFPEANDIGVPPYPLTAAQGAIYYRDLVAQSPFNIKNIQTVRGGNELGNYTYKYEVINTAGAWLNPRQFIENQPTLPSISFQLRATGTTQIRGLWDIHRGTENHFEWVPDYSTAYLTGSPNKSVLVTKFRVAGGIEQETLGYNDFKSREYSVYNAVPYRNLTVLKPSQGPSGTISEPVGGSPSEMRVYDIHGLDYGLISHESRHTARFGRDSLQIVGTTAATNGPGASYDQAPGWHKVNRNNKQVIEIESTTEMPVYSIPVPILNTKALTLDDDDNNNSASRKLRTDVPFSDGFADDTIAISAWINRHTANPNGQSEPIVALGQDSSSFGSPGKSIIQFGMTTDWKLYFRVELGNSAPTPTDGHWYVDSPSASADGGWYHVAVSYDASITSNEPTLYINAVSMSLTTTSTPSLAGLHDISSVGPGYNYIGAMHQGASSFPPLRSSSLDEIAIYNTALTHAEVSKIYCGGTIVDLTSSYAPATASLITWLRLGDDPSDPSEPFNVGDEFVDIKGNNTFKVLGSSADMVYDTGSLPGGCDGGIVSYREEHTYKTASIYDNWFVQHQIPQSDRQYAWITESIVNGQSIRYAGFQSTCARGMGPYLSTSSGLINYYDFVTGSDVVADSAGTALPGGLQPTNRLNILTVDPVTGATDDIATNTLGFPNTSNISQYLNTTLNPTLRETDYLNLILCRRQAKYGWTWRQLHQYDHPVLVRERSYNTITAITGAGQTLLTGYRLPPVSLKGRPALINFDSPSRIKKTRNNATLRITDNNEHIFFNDVQMNNLTNMKRSVTPFDQIVITTLLPHWYTKFVVYRQNVFPSMKNEFASWSTGYDRTTTYKNNVWNNNFDTRVALADSDNPCGILVSQSMFCLDPPGSNRSFVGGPVPTFLERTGALEINIASEVLLRDNGLGGSLQNAKFSYMTGLAVEEDSVATDYRRMRSLVPGPLGWAKHMVGSPNSVTRIGCQDIPETGSLTGSFDPDEQIEIYGGEADWQSDTPTKAGVVVFNPDNRTAEFQVTGSEPWFETYNEYWQDLKLMAQGYSVLPEFRISEHVEDYLSYGIANKGLMDTFEFPGVAPTLNSTQSYFYTTYTNSDFMQGFLKIPRQALLSSTEIRLTCDAAIRWRPQPSFYPAQRAAEMVSQFSKSYGDGLVGVFRGEAVLGAPGLFQNNGGCLRPMFEALYSPGILFNSLKAGIACNYPVILDSSQISGTWFGTNASGATNNWALVPGNVLGGKITPSNVHANRSKYPAEGYFGNSPFYKLPFETIIEPGRHLNGLTFYDAQPHPSMSLTYQYSSSTGPYQGTEVGLVSKTDDPAYMLFARNFLGEIPNMFLKGGTFSSLKSNVVPADLTFQKSAGQAGAGYFMRIKMVPPSNGLILRANEVDSEGTNNAYGKHGARYWNNNLGIGRVETWGSGEFEIPQWPLYSPEFKRIQTNTVRTTAYSSIAVAGRPSGTAGTINENINNKCFLDSFVGSNPLYTHPMADGEAWIDCWFYPTASDGRTVEKYDLERILSEVQIRTWRFDPGYVTSSASGEQAPALISGNLTAPMYYDGHLINQVAMQATGALNYLGIERIFKTEIDRAGNEIKSTNETVGMRWVISPKFETPTFNFSDQGIKPITSASSNLTIPIYASASVNRGIWQQFGAYPTNPREYPRITIEGPDDGGGGLRQWLKYHYKVMNEESIYNNYNAENGSRVARNTKSLAKLVGFDRDSRSTPLGVLPEKMVIKEAVVAVPYILKDAIGLDRCSVEKQTKKRFISIPPKRVKAALKESQGTPAGDSLQQAGVSIRNLAQRMEDFVLPPQLDWVHNSDIKPMVMYIFPFEYELDKDDLAYIYQNLAPRESKKIRMKSTSVAHNLLDTELLRSQNIMTTDQLRWMVFKVKQRSMSDYYDHVPNNAGEASIQLTEQYKRKTHQELQRTKEPDREYQIAYNWPYDYISLIELARLDVEVMYRPTKKQRSSQLQKVKQLKKRPRRSQGQGNLNSGIGGAPARRTKKKGGGGKY